MAYDAMFQNTLCQNHSAPAALLTNLSLPNLSCVDILSAVCRHLSGNIDILYAPFLSWGYGHLLHGSVILMLNLKNNPYYLVIR